jgi:dUTPase
MHKLGLMLANSVGIIDRGYTGEVIVAAQLTPTMAAMLIGGKANTIEEVNKIVADYIKKIELPAYLVQLVIRAQQSARITTSISLQRTERGSNGFGSTGK